MKDKKKMELQKSIYADATGQSEDALQQKCYLWFWNNFPLKRGLLFAVPNGGRRSGKEAKLFRLTGVVKGVSDLILLHLGKTYLLEMKTETGTQSKDQKDWEDKVTSEGFEYHLIRSVSDFKVIVCDIILGK